MSRGGFFNQLKDDFTKAFRPSAPRCGMLRLPRPRPEALAAWRAVGIPQFPPCLCVCARVMPPRASERTLAPNRPSSATYSPTVTNAPTVTYTPPTYTSPVTYAPQTVTYAQPTVTYAPMPQPQPVRTITYTAPAPEVRTVTYTAPAPVQPPPPPPVIMERPPMQMPMPMQMQMQMPMPPPQVSSQRRTELLQSVRAQLRGFL
jgi:hypothetical protein